MYNVSDSRLSVAGNTLDGVGKVYKRYKSRVFWAIFFLSLQQKPVNFILIKRKAYSGEPLTLIFFRLATYTRFPLEHSESLRRGPRSKPIKAVPPPPYFSSYSSLLIYLATLSYTCVYYTLACRSFVADREPAQGRLWCAGSRRRAHW